MNRVPLIDPYPEITVGWFGVNRFGFSFYFTFLMNLFVRAPFSMNPFVFPKSANFVSIFFLPALY